MHSELLRILPQAVRTALCACDTARIEELRLRVGQPPTILLSGTEHALTDCVLTQRELQQTLLSASAQSQYAVQEQLAAGFLSIEGGIRVGVCGSAVVQEGRVRGLREISSLAIRLPHEVRHPARQLLPLLDGSCLLLGRPGSGKTTLLRSCIRVLSASGQRVAVVDERLELAGAVHGAPQFDLGPHTDVLSGCPKREGMLMLLRGMNPDWIAVDEITGPEDLEAVRQVCGCGVRLLATLHAQSADELRGRALFRQLLSRGGFSRLLILDKNRAFHAERIQYAEIDRTEPDSDSLHCGGAAACRCGEAAANADAGAY